MRGEWAKLSADTGLGYHWLGKFAQGRILAPAGRKIEALMEHKRRNRRK